MSFSISAKRATGGAARLEQPTAFTQGTLAPTTGEAVEIRLDETTLAGLDKGDVWNAIQTLLNEIRRRGEPRFS